MSKKTKRRQKTVAVPESLVKNADWYLSFRVAEFKTSMVIGYLIALVVVVALVAQFFRALPSSLEQKSQSDVPSCLDQCQASADQKSCLNQCRSQQLEQISLPKTQK